MGTLVCDCVGMSSSPGLAIVSGVLALGAALAVGVGLSSVHWYTIESSLNDIDVGLTGFCQSSTISLLDPTGGLGFAVESCVSLVDQIHFLEHVNSVLGGASEALKQTRQLWYGSISAIVACSLAIIGYVVLLAAAAFCATSHFLGDPEASRVVGRGESRQPRDGRNRGRHRMGCMGRICCLVPGSRLRRLPLYPHPFFLPVVLNTSPPRLFPWQSIHNFWIPRNPRLLILPATSCSEKGKRWSNVSSPVRRPYVCREKDG